MIFQMSAELDESARGSRENTSWCFKKAKMRLHLPDKQFFINKYLPTRPTIKIVEYRGSGNNAHVFRAHSDDLGRDVACKIIPKNNLIGPDQDPPAWRAEVLKANRLRTSAVVKFSDMTEWIHQQD